LESFQNYDVTNEHAILLIFVQRWYSDTSAYCLVSPWKK